jgi:hypothetical protein
MNNRVSEAEKKRGEIEPHDMSTKEAKILSAEERKAAILKETQEKGAAEIAKVLVCLLFCHVVTVCLLVSDSSGRDHVG